MRPTSILELNNLRLAFSAFGLATDLAADAGFAAAAARALLLPDAARGRRGPPSAGIFPPFSPRPESALAGRRVGVVASGGAGATASLTGVQRAFEEAGVVPAAISACSGAVLFGSLWAAGLSAQEVADFWLGLADRDYLDPDWPALARAVARRFRGWGGLLRGEAIERAFHARLGDRTLGEARIPFSAVVWNIDENRVEHIGTRQTPSLTFARAARVAVSLPPLVAPVRIGPHVYGDGGIVDIFPVSPLLDEEPLDAVFGLNCYYAERFLGEDVSGFLDEPWSILRASGQLRWAGHLELARERMRALGDRLTLLHPVPYEETRGASFYRDFFSRRRWPRTMRLGHEHARAALAGWACAQPRATPVRAVRPERMPPVNGAWLRMETPDNPMTITSIMFFDEPVDPGNLQALAALAVEKEPRLRQRLDASGGSWVPVASVDLGRHLGREHARSAAELEAIVARLGSEPLDRGRPLWHLQHVTTPTGSALVTRLHHAIGDGAALMSLLLALAGPGAPPFSTAGASRTLKPADLANRKLLAGRALARLATLPPDRATSLRAPLSGAKRFAWSDPLPLPLILAVARAAGATVNDVLLSALAGALRRLLAERGERTHDLVLHAVVPVNLRSGEKDLGNRFGLAFAPLPLGIVDPGRRLAEVARATAELRASPDAAVTLLTLAGLGMVTPAVHAKVTKFFGSKASLVITNVPGPGELVSFAGQPVTSMVFFAPESARLGLGVSILGYAGQLRVGIASDAAVCDRPAGLVESLTAELRALGAVAPRRAAAAEIATSVAS